MKDEKEEVKEHSDSLRPPKQPSCLDSAGKIRPTSVLGLLFSRSSITIPSVRDSSDSVEQAIAFYLPEVVHFFRLCLIISFEHESLSNTFKSILDHYFERIIYFG